MKLLKNSLKNNYDYGYFKRILNLLVKFNIAIVCTETQSLMKKIPTVRLRPSVEVKPSSTVSFYVKRSSQC